MVGLATRTSNNRKNLSIFGGKGNINSLELPYIEKNVDEGEQKLLRCCRKNFGPWTVKMVF